MRISLFVSILFGFLVVATGPVHSTPIPSTGTVDVFFSPKGGVTEAIVQEINAAKSEILIQAYGFTSKPISKALLDAKKRGIEIVAVLDKSNATAKYSAATFLAHAGGSVFIDRSHTIAHNKIIIIDRSVLITGSFNFTSAAENKNAENLLVIKENPLLVEKYHSNFEAHKSHSVPYSR